MAEVQDIFASHIENYKQKYNLSAVQKKAVRAILACRTSALGAHIDRCDECGFEKISYNSCRNRHCPKCQTFAKEEWIDRQKQNLINAQYFHVVFTVPSELHPLFRQSQETLYALLFRAASETVLELCADNKFLGAKPGITAVLHTWGQNLCFHPHLHLVVTGGGLTSEGKWKPSRKKFFLPVRVLSKKFRGKFLHFLQEDKPEANLDALVWKLRAKDWVVYCKPPFGNAEKVIEYLGRYTHRVAIANNRIIKLEDGSVTFRWRDYSDGNKTKLLILAAAEFIRRFLLHILPPGFRKIRHYGIFASRDKMRRLKLADCSPARSSESQPHQSWTGSSRSSARILISAHAAARAIWPEPRLWGKPNTVSKPPIRLGRGKVCPD